MPKFVYAVLFMSLTFACGLSNAQQNPASGFDYADFLARNPVPEINYDAPNALDSDDYDPASPAAQELLEKWDALYAAVNLDAGTERGVLYDRATSCSHGDCQVWASVSKGAQRLSLYVDGVLQDTWPVSTGKAGHSTPNFEKHPDGRIYDSYSSAAYPGGDYNGLGNMPYAVFISGGFAIHGTPKSNWSMLGQKASHGCIRLHPDNAYHFNRLVREEGVKNTWISVEQ